jgi:hypothetical protein
VSLQEHQESEKLARLHCARRASWHQHAALRGALDEASWCATPWHLQEGSKVYHSYADYCGDCERASTR